MMSELWFTANEPWKEHNYFLGYIRGCTAFYYRGYYIPLWESLWNNQYNRKSDLFFSRDPTEIPAESIDEFPDLHESLGPEALAKTNGKKPNGKQPLFSEVGNSSPGKYPLKWVPKNLLKWC